LSDRVRWQCERWLASQRPQTVPELLRAAADSVPAETEPDRYGEGAVVEEFEARFAEILGMESAVLLPSGTMAQQIALRIHCEHRGLDTVAFHPTCHLELHEHAGYAHLHGLKAELIGHRDRLIELADLEAVRVALGAVLLELPQREIGGQLPEWQDLAAQADWVRAQGAALHLDGARIWESAPFYERSPAEIAGLFDTVYVSLYKGLGGWAGSILAGSEEFVDAARIWRRRHGGTLSRLFPFAVAAMPGLSTLVDQMARFLGHARDVAAALSALPGVTVVPNPPHTPLFHVHLYGDPEALCERAEAVARERKVWLFDRLPPTAVPGVSLLELNLGEPALEISSAEVAELFGEVLR
jgi:threonine aldolase